ncbi:hypothetical protein QYE76_067731 [Lolium multiflorum]|uniref:HRDC domain-containing protein n=1 Tax=Lolium multiflorum TaxID=4521 RepID=A0AAD8SCY8_LOLMU|nr:hypothetical protein QYE76_067731 [Lolium multiflorum]
MFELDTVELNMPRARRAMELQEDAEAWDRRLVACSKKEKKKKKKNMATARRAQAYLSGKKEAEMHMPEEVFWTGEAFGGSGPVTKSSRVKKAAASGTKAPSTPIPRPQDVYHIVVDNTNKPFEHALLEKSPDGGARPTHPLEKLPVEQLFDRRVPQRPPLKPPELSDTPFTFVQDRKTLNKLVRKLKNATEFAVNVEYNHFRSFQGLTCLMQISTRTEDFIVDTLKLRKYLGERLREAFQDPTKKKVMYGTTRDIMWLQRDFGIYICNLFDIGQASRILQMGHVSLKHLLLSFCGVIAKKRLKENELSARQLAVLAGLYQWRDSVARIEDESTAYILPSKTLLEIAKQIPVTARRFKRTVEAKNKFLDHHLGHVITIIRNAVANSDSFENIAEQLKKERLEELMVADTKSSSEDTETITAVDADNNESNSHSSDEPALVPGFSSEQGHVPKAPFFTLIVDGSLDCSAICGTLKKVLKWMGFDQLTMVIMYKIIPFMKSCPEELRPKLEEANKLGLSLIIQLTRAASELLAVIACPQLYGSSEFLCSRSLVGYVLCHDVLRLEVLSLIYYIFGAWNVDEAKMTLVPLCYKVMEVATATRHDAIISFVEDMIPHLIQWLPFESSLEGTQPGDVIIKDLCYQAFRCVHCPNQVEEEFSKYIPGYIDMLHQVNEMDDCLERDSSSPRVIFEKLDPKFVSKYAIGSPSHDYLWAMSAMVKHSSYDDSVVELVEESDAYPDLAEFLRADALEEHKDVLKKILHHVTSLENITFLQPLLPDVRDFPVRLRPYAKNYIDNRNKEYIVAKEQARLHEQFDAHLASGVLDHYLSKGDAGSHGDALKAVLNDSRQFSALDHDLIKLSFERRAELLGRRDQLHLFYKCFQRVTRDAQLRIEVQSLIDQLGRQDFFCIDDDAIDWDQKCCSELVDKFNKQVFTGSDLPKYYVIRGIMDYQAMSRMKDGSCSWCDVFQKVVGKPYDRWIQNIPSFWMDTRYYKHQYYDIIQQPLQKIWKKEE